MSTLLGLLFSIGSLVLLWLAIRPGDTLRVALGGLFYIRVLVSLVMLLVPVRTESR